MKGREKRTIFIRPNQVLCYFSMQMGRNNEAVTVLGLDCDEAQKDNGGPRRTVAHLQVVRR